MPPTQSGAFWLNKLGKLRGDFRESWLVEAIPRAAGPLHAVHEVGSLRVLGDVEYVFDFVFHGSNVTDFLDLSTPTFVLSAQLPTMGIGSVSDNRFGVTPNTVFKTWLIPVPPEAFNVSPHIRGPHLKHAAQTHYVLAYQCHVPFSFHTYTLPRFNSKSMRHQVNAQRHPVNLTPPIFEKISCAKYAWVAGGGFLNSTH